MFAAQALCRPKWQLVHCSSIICNAVFCSAGALLAAADDTAAVDELDETDATDATDEATGAFEETEETEEATGAFDEIDATDEATGAFEEDVATATEDTAALAELELPVSFPAQAVKSTKLAVNDARYNLVNVDIGLHRNGYINNAFLNKTHGIKCLPPIINSHPFACRRR